MVQSEEMSTIERRKTWYRMSDAGNKVGIDISQICRELKLPKLQSHRIIGRSVADLGNSRFRRHVTRELGGTDFYSYCLLMKGNVIVETFDARVTCTRRIIFAVRDKTCNV